LYVIVWISLCLTSEFGDHGPVGLKLNPTLAGERSIKLVCIELENHKNFCIGLSWMDGYNLFFNMVKEIFTEKPRWINWRMKYTEKVYIGDDNTIKIN